MGSAVKIREVAFILSLCLMPIALGQAQDDLEDQAQDLDVEAIDWEAWLSEIDLGIEWDALIREGASRSREGDLEEGLQLLNQALEIAEQATGPKAKEGLGANLLFLGMMYERVENPSEANSTYLRLVKVVEDIDGPESPGLASILAELYGPFLERQGEYEAAEEAFRLSLSIHEKLHGKDSLEVANDLIRLGRVHAFQQDSTTARALYKRALSIREEALGPEHPDVVAIEDTLTTMTLNESQARGTAQADPQSKPKGVPLNLSPSSGDDKQQGETDGATIRYFKTDIGSDLPLGVIVDLGGTRLTFSSPVDFVEATVLSPETRTLLEALTPQESRLLAGYVTRRDYERISRGEDPHLDRHAAIQVFRELEEVSMTEATFELFRGKLRVGPYVTEEIKERTQAQLDELLIDSIDRVEVGEMRPLGVISEDATHLSLLALANYSVGENRTPVTKAVSISYLLLKDRVIFAYVYATVESNSDVDWVRSTAADWIKTLKRENSSISQRTSSAAPVSSGKSLQPSQSGSLLEGVEEKAVAGAILGVVASLAVTFFGIFRRRKTKS